MFLFSYQSVFNHSSFKGVLLDDKDNTSISKIKFQNSLLFLMLRYLSINLCPGTRHFVVSSDPVVQNLSRLVPVNLPTVRGIRH